MIVDVDKKQLEHFRNYLSFQRNGSYNEGIKVNFLNFIKVNEISDIIPESVDGIKSVLYKNVDGPTLDVFFNGIGDFKPWMRVNVLDEKLYLVGGPDQYTYEVKDDDPCIGNWKCRCYLQTDFMLELISNKHPEVNRVNSKPNDFNLDTITLNTDHFVGLDNKSIFPHYARVQVLPLDKFDNLFELINGVTKDEIDSFHHLTAVYNISIPYENLCKQEPEKIKEMRTLKTFFNKYYNKMLRYLFTPIGKDI